MAGGSRALLLCAGIGTRLRPLTDVLPKCLMPVCGRPLLGHWLEMLRAAGLTEIVVNLHHHADLVREYIRRSPYSRFVTPVYEEKLLGTGGTLLRNKDFFSGAPVLMAHADNLTVFDPERFLRAHRARPASAVMTMMTFKASAPESCGVVELDSRGVVTGFHEKVANPPGNLANAAVYLLEPAVVAFLESLDKTIIDFSNEAIPNFLGKISTFHNDIYHRDIGTLSSLAHAQLDYPFSGLLDFPPQRRGQSDDPWYGLIADNDARLAKEWVRTLDSVFARNADWKAR